MLVNAIAIGLVLNFFLFELTGLVAGGLVAPGYFAVYWDQPFMIAFNLTLALVTTGLLRLSASITILYGRRRFILCILVGFALQWIVGSAVMGLEMAQGRIDAVGYIIPGLVAHEMDRQGVGITLIALLILSVLVRLSLHVLNLERPF
jgi:poly-gamma-glutamate biosynthesis protein PgsC/CapC